MSATTSHPDVAKPPADDQLAGEHAPTVAVWSTIIALAATVLALVDLIVHGLGTTAVHVLAGLTVFTSVRLCVGVSLNPRPLTEFTGSDDAPETTP